MPVNQGIFVHDIDTRSTRIVAKTGGQFAEFLFWNYSGKTPYTGGGHSEEGAEDDGEPARWRSSAFVAVAGGVGATYQAAFKARTGELVWETRKADPEDGFYHTAGPVVAAGVVISGITGWRSMTIIPSPPRPVISPGW